MLSHKRSISPLQTSSASTLPSEVNPDTILAWTAPEFEPSPANARILLALGAIFSGVVIYALFKNSAIMAITFVLLGMVTMLHGTRPAKEVPCAIRKDGVLLGKELYVFENIRSFWIIYEPGEHNLFLVTSGSLLSSVRVPLGTTSPETVRSTLRSLGIREVPYEPTLVDILSNFLHI